MRSTADGTGKIEARAWQTLFITSVSIFLVAMDVTIVSVALPGISRSFRHASQAELSWVFTAYNITFAALLLLAGKFGDRLGRKRAFLGGLVIFMTASVLAGLAPSAAVLIGARVLQAAGSALIYPASLALLLPEFPSSRRSMAIGLWGGIAGLGGAIAPTLGALLVDWAGWRSVFFINVPFVAAALIAGTRVLRESKAENARDRFDPVAVPVAALAVGLLVLGVVQGEPWGWGDPRTLGCSRARPCCCRGSSGARRITPHRCSTSVSFACARSRWGTWRKRSTFRDASAGSCSCRRSSLASGVGLRLARASAWLPPPPSPLCSRH